MKSSALAALGLACFAAGAASRAGAFDIVGDAEPFAPGIASTEYSDVRLTISPDGKTALWFSRNRPGGAGGYDIWMSRHGKTVWTEAEPVPFNSASRDFDPAFSADGRYVYFCSDRAGGLGGDDLWRVRITPGGFGAPENLGAAVNSPRNEWAPMLSPDGSVLLFSSDGRGARRMDLFLARVIANAFESATLLPGELNSEQDEFDATFLADGTGIVFSRAPDIARDPVLLFHAAPVKGAWPRGARLPAAVNTPDSDTYAPMLDWSQPNSLTFTTRRPANSTRGVDLYVVKYRP